MSKLRMLSRMLRKGPFMFIVSGGDPARRALRPACGRRRRERCDQGRAAGRHRRGVPAKRLGDFSQLEAQRLADAGRFDGMTRAQIDDALWERFDAARDSTFAR